MSIDQQLTLACKRLKTVVDARKSDEAHAPILTKKGATLYIVNRAELDNLRAVDRAIMFRI
jgi:hypothetical protein